MCSDYLKRRRILLGKNLTLANSQILVLETNIKSLISDDNKVIKVGEVIYSYNNMFTTGDYVSYYNGIVLYRFDKPLITVVNIDNVIAKHIEG